MSTPNQARIELGTAGANIAGNIEALLPQLASRGAEIAKAGNQIHQELVSLRSISIEFRDGKSDVIEPVAFDKAAEKIENILPQLSGHGADVDAIAAAIKGYLNQLKTVHAQHLHLVDENAPVVAGLPHVNNGVGTGPFDTGTAVAAKQPDAKVDPNPTPLGDGQPTKAVSLEPGKAGLVPDPSAPAGAAAAAR